ncbi:hypothetical protein D3C78_1105090 [compost metagenome]
MIAASTAARSPMSTRVEAMPKRPSSFSIRLWVVPYSSRLAIRWSPAPSTPCSAALIAAIPEAQNSASSPPSRSRISASSAAGLGLPMRVYMKLSGLPARKSSTCASES